MNTSTWRPLWLSLIVVSCLLGCQSRPEYGVETNSNKINYDTVSIPQKAKYLYTLNLKTKEFDSISKKIQIKGANSYKVTVDVWAKIANRNDTEGEFHSHNYAEDRQLVDKKYDNIRVVLKGTDGSIKFTKNEKLVDSIVIVKNNIAELDTIARRILSAKENFIIDENHRNRTKETSIIAAVYLQDSNETIQSQTLELQIVPLTFSEKLHDFYIDAGNETIKKMNVLYTALLGVLVSAIIAFVKRKLGVKEETK